MPYPNEHAARQRNPDDFERLRRSRPEGFPEGISAIIGFRSDGSSDIQSIRADRAAFTPAEFRRWLESRGYKTEIEEAREVADEKDEMSESRDRRRDPGFWGPPRRVVLSEDDGRSWVEVVRSGTFYGSTGPKPRRVELSSEDILSMASSFSTILSEGWFNGGAPVGVNHATAYGSRDAESTKAMARIQEVEARPNDDGSLSLWGLFEWTNEGAERVRSGEFSSISAELIPPAASTSKLTGEPMGSWALVGATLTNSPMIPGMRPPSVSVTVAASDDHPQRVALSEDYRTPRKRETPMSDNLLLKLAEATGLPSDHGALIGEIRSLQEQASKTQTLTEALEIATTEVEGLRSRNEHLEDREKTRALDEACAIGRIAPAERETYWKMLETLGETETHRVMTEGRIPVSRDSKEAPLEAAPSTNEDAFLALIDKAVAEGMSHQAAWDFARSTGASSLYNDNHEN